jgi:hypothetical protein
MQKKYSEISTNAMSSEMFFAKENEANNEKEGRYSTPTSMPSFSERIQDHMAARSSIGSGNNREAIKQTANNIYEKGQYVANGAYVKASVAKSAALDWITSMTNKSSNN